MPGTVPSGGDAVSVLGEGAPANQEQPPLGFGWILAFSVLGGLLLNLMPCVFPILGLKALSLAKMGGDEAEVRRDALAYYREVASHCALDVRQYRTVEAVAPIHDASVAVTPSGRPVQWRVMTRPLVGAPSALEAHALVIATGYFGNPRRLGVPGEGLPHVRHGYTEGHTAWGQQVVIVGGANSAVDAALTMLRAGARVTLVHTGEGISDRVKPWVRPEIEARIREGRITVRFGSRVTAIEPEAVCVAGPAGEEWLPATQVYTMIGYHPETGLLAQAGVPIDAESGIPAHDPATMATPVRGVYLAGVIASGNQANRIFIENGRDHGDAIIAHLTGAGSTVSP